MCNLLVKGTRYYYNTKAGISYAEQSLEEQLAKLQIPVTSEIYLKILSDKQHPQTSYLITDAEFLDSALDGCLTDYDGYIHTVYVDGYATNLGLHIENVTSGRFDLDGLTWIDLCNRHDVYVDWVNK